MLDLFAQFDKIAFLLNQEETSKCSFIKKILNKKTHDEFIDVYNDLKNELKLL